MQKLETLCVVTKDSLGVEGARILTFCFGQAITTIRIVMDDTSGTDLAITHMTTLPEVQIGNGFGSKALRTLLTWAEKNDLRDIRAIQVQRRSERFWTKNGFISLNNPTNDFKYEGGK